MAENDTQTAPVGLPELPPQQFKAIMALLSARDVRAAAKVAGVAERTLHRWLGEPLFQAELNAREGMIIDHATRRLLGLQDVAIDTLQQVMADKAAPASIRLRAATATLELLLKVRELRNFETRLNAIEFILIQEHRHDTRKP